MNDRIHTAIDWILRIAIIIVLIFILSNLINRSAQGADDSIVLYDFAETAGAIIHDNSAIVPTLDLTIADPTKVQWLNPGLRIKEATVARATSARTKLTFPQGITIEVWLKPVNNTQDGPARVITFSADSGNRNFTFGQAAEHWDQRFRTSENPGNGNTPSLSTPAASIKSTPALQHVVYTRSVAGTATFYIDGLKVQTLSIPGDLSNWDPSYGFGLFNEINFPTDTRTWLGDIFKVAIYGTVLNDGEIQQKFLAGLPPSQKTGSVTVAWDANTEENLQGYKIYYGRLSRFETIGAIQAWCTAHEPNNDKCVEEWETICKNQNAYGSETTDPACHQMLFDYEKVVEVKNVNEYTITGLIRGVTYYLAATAYADPGVPRQESLFSTELTHFVAVTAPAGPEKLIFKMAPME